MSSQQTLLTIAQAAGALNVSIKTVRRRIKSREINVVRIGRAVRIHPSELRRYMSMNWDHGRPSPFEVH